MLGSTTKQAVPQCHLEAEAVTKASQPLLMCLSWPWLAGEERVAVLTWPGFLFLQEALSWSAETPYPWVEQKPPGTHLPLMAAWSCRMSLASP